MDSMLLSIAKISAGEGRSEGVCDQQSDIRCHSSSDTVRFAGRIGLEGRSPRTTRMQTWLSKRLGKGGRPVNV